MAIAFMFTIIKSNAQLHNNQNSSISITYSYNYQKYYYPDFNATINTASDAVNGSGYNYGNAISYNISSSQTYLVKISSQQRHRYGNNFNNNYEKDIRNYIFYSIADNNTGGRIYRSNVQTLGTEERTLLANCPQTRFIHESAENHFKSFSLIFWAKVGYSVPPGQYKTFLLITATTE